VIGAAIIVAKVAPGGNASDTTGGRPWLYS